MMAATPTQASPLRVVGFSGGLGAWSVGAAVFTEKIVQCRAAGDWGLFTFDQLEMAAFAAFFAGPAALALHFAGIRPIPKQAPEEPSNETPSA